MTIKQQSCLACGTPVIWANGKLVCPKSTCKNYNKET